MMLKKRIISLMLLVSLVMMPVSAVIIHLQHKTAIGHPWLHIHVLFGVVFMITGICHVVFNWRILKHYLMGRK